MAKFTLEMSGSGGLVHQYGDTVAHRYLANNGQVVSGDYNPFLKPGYLAPASGSITNVTGDQTFSASFCAKEYDPVNDDFYLLEAGRQLFKGDTTADTALERVYNFPASSVGKDLAIYVVNGVRRLFALYQTAGGTIGIDHMPLPATFASVTFTADTGTENITPASGTWSNGMAVQLTTTGTLPAPLATSTTYYVVNAGGGVFQLSTTFGGSTIDITTTGSGTHTVTLVPTSLVNTAAGTSIASNTLSGDAFMIVADNGFAYVCMENQVHKFDGNTTGGSGGTITPNALLFPPSFRIVDGIDLNGFIYLGIHQFTNDTRSINPTFEQSGSVQTGIYVWDRRTTTSQTQDFVPLPGVKDIRKIFVSPSGSLRILCRTNENITSIMEYNGRTFQTIHDVGYDKYPTYRDSVDTFRNTTIWASRDGISLAYGSLFPGDKEGLFRLTSYTVDTNNGGILLPAVGSAGTAPAMYISYVSSTPKLGRFNLFTVPGQLGSGTDAQKNTPIVFPVQLLPSMSTLKSIYIHGAPAESSSSSTQATVKIYLNGSSTEWATKTITAADMVRGYFHIQVNNPYVNSVQLAVTYNSSVNITKSSFFPSFATIEYEPTATIK